MTSKNDKVWKYKKNQCEDILITDQLTDQQTDLKSDL